MFQKMKMRIENWMNPKDRCSSDMLFKLLFGQNDIPPSTKDLEIACGLEIEKRPVQVAVIRVGDGICNPEMLDTLIKSCDSVSDSDEVLSVSDGCNQVVLLFFCDTLWKWQTHEILEDIQKDFLAVWPASRLYITLGSIEDYVELGEPAWQKSYRTAIGLQDYRYIKAKGKVIAYSDIVSRRKIYPKGIDFRFNLLRENLEAEKPDKLLAWLSDSYSMVSGEGMDTMGLRYHLTLEIVVNAVSVFREKGLSAEVYIGQPEELIGQVLSIKTPQGVHRWTEIFLENAREALKQYKTPNTTMKVISPSLQK